MQNLVTKPSWTSTDIEAWSSHYQGRSLDGFGASASRVDTFLIYFEDAFDPDHSKVVVVALADWVASEYEKWEHGMKRKEEERMN